MKFLEFMNHIKATHNTSHVFTEHPNTYFRKVPLEVKEDHFFNHWPTQKVPLYHLEVDGQQFISFVHRCNVKKQWFFYVVMIASKPASKHYLAVISVTAKDNVIYIKYYN